ncbi:MULTISPECIES: glycosyltransferase [unclassified Enterococcus]|uniref:glycosyltransferase n=1 Tax=unclassified Enterococcus TaxID=2608891 RepID=UPI0013ED66B4|nr:MULTISPECIES: glycosyltransferase [unclassified Enterococcus]
MKPKIAVTIVLYQQLFSRIPAFEELKRAVEEKKIQLVIYDNSEHEQKNPVFDEENVLYHHDPKNPGLAAAYNFSLAQLPSDTCCFVTLDQDTVLTESYVHALSEIHFEEDVIAAVPMVFDHGKQVSPVYSDDYVNRTFQAVKESGIISERVMAINSGAAFSFSFLQEIGGFNPVFALDFLDHWLFWKIHEAGKKVEVLPVRLEHELSVMDYANVTTKRYHSILTAENQFYQKYDHSHWPDHRRQLLLRTFKQFLTVKNREIWRLTLRSYIENWKV